MWIESREIIEACQAIGIKYQYVPNLKAYKPDIQNFFINGVVYGGDLKRSTWVSLYGSIGVIESFALTEEHILFFDEVNDSSALIFNKINDLIKALYESPRMDFFIADRGLNYILYYNRHDKLALTGLALQWIPSIQAQIQY